MLFGLCAEVWMVADFGLVEVSLVAIVSLLFGWLMFDTVRVVAEWWLLVSLVRAVAIWIKVKIWTA